MRLGLLGIFTWSPQVLHPAHTWDWSAAGAAGAGGSTVRRLWRIDGGGQRGGAAGLRFEVAAVASAGYLTPALTGVGMGLGAPRMGGTREMVNSRVMSPGKLREQLGELVTGPVLGAGDPAYEESRRVFNAMIDRHPAAILKCSCAEDVVHGVIAAREYDLPLSIKGCGHSVAGNAV